MNVALQPGKVKLTYQESIKAKSDDDRIYFEVPAGLTVTVSSAGGGEPLEIKGPGFRGSGSSVSTGSGWSRAVIGTVEIPGAGEYTVAASPAAEGAVEPRILIGV
jgi:hypothetical protein